nr:hypothetical protein [Tanacetum cinerariifolium]
MVRSTLSRYIPSNKTTPVIAWLRKNSEKERAATKTPTPLHTLKNKKIRHYWSGKTYLLVDNLGPNKDDEGVEWLDVEEPLDLVDINETKEITFKTSYKEPERSKLSSEGHDLLSSRVILSKDDYDRGCRKPSDLEEGLYRDTIKLGIEYVTGMDDEGEVTKFLIKNEEEIFTDAGDGVGINTRRCRVIFDEKRLGNS